MEMNVDVVLGVRAKRDPVFALGHILSPSGAAFGAAQIVSIARASGRTSDAPRPCVRGDPSTCGEDSDARHNPVDQTGKSAARPRHLPYNLHAVALVKRARHGILFSDREVQVTTTGL